MARPGGVGSGAQPLATHQEEHIFWATDFCSLLDLFSIATARTNSATTAPTSPQLKRFDLFFFAEENCRRRSSPCAPSLLEPTAAAVDPAAQLLTHLFCSGNFAQGF